MLLSTSFHGAATISASLDVVRAADSAKLDGVWSAEHLGLHDGLVPSTVFLANTSHLTVGAVGINPFSRHPGLFAMELASIEEYWPGRTRFQLGVGDARLAARLGLDAKRKALANVAAFVDSLRRLLSGQTVTLDAPAFSMREFNVRHGQAVPPLDLMAIGPKMIELACDVGDGVALSVGASRAYLGEAVSSVLTHLDAKRRAREEFRVSANVICSVDDVWETAWSRAARTLVSSLLRRSSDVLIGPALAELVPSTERLRSALENEGADGAAALLPDELVHALALIATPDSLATELALYAKTGIDEVALKVLGPPDVVTTTVQLLGDLRRRTSHPRTEKYDVVVEQH